MSSETSRVKSESRNQPETAVRRLAARKATLRRLSLDALETRTLMAVLPAPVLPAPVLPAPVFATTGGPAILPSYQTSGAVLVSPGGGSHSDDSSPSIAIDPLDPSKMVAAWTHNDPFFAPGRTEFVQYGVSTDGGKTWRNQGQPGPSFLFDPRTTGAGLQQFSQGTDASVQFDRNNNFYVLWSEHTASNDSGALRLEKFDFSGTSPTVAPTFTGGPTLVYEWVTDQAVKPVLAVDTSVPTFSDKTADGTTRSQNDTYANNVYVSWQTVDQAPPNPGNFNPNRIAITASSDGGVSFSGEQYLNTGGNFGNQRNATPQLAISQGSAARPAGTNGPNDPGTAGVSPGLVTGVWDDFGTAASIPRDRIVTGGIANGAFSQTFPAPTTSPKFVGISSGIVFTKGAPVTPQTTDVPIDVNVTDPRFVSLTHLTANLIVSLVGTAANNGNGDISGLDIQLVPPNGSGLPTVTLLRNKIDANGNDTGGGAAGSSLGFLNFNNIGTTFDDLAARNVVNGPTPIVGHFRPELGSLDGPSGYGGAIAGSPNSPNSINGQWTLRFTNFLANNTAVLEGDSLDFTSGFTPNTTNTVIAQTPLRAAQSGGATVAAADSQGIAPAPVIASDNTLGAFSPYEGRLYVSYVGRSTRTTTPADNTDIRLVTSDDGGSTWYDPSQSATGFQNQGSTNFGAIVNDDNAQADGYSEGGNLTPPQTGATANTNPFNLNASPQGAPNGRPQFQPSVAVDPTNGTLALSWYDARNDAARARVATYLTTSIDGGNNFSPDVYANDSQIATDAITGAVQNLGPIPANENAPSSTAFDTFLQGYGSHQGLAVYGGLAHPVWADNQNGGTDNKQTTSIYTNNAYFATGPRVVSVTSGPVGQPGDTLNTDTQADGTPVASTFLVTFDRPIDPSTFTAADAIVQYRDVTPNGLTSGPRPVLSVVPVATSVNQFGATQFLVNFGGGNGVGTYSLEITSADISDRIRTVSAATSPVGQPVTVTASTDSPRGTVPATANNANPAVVTIPVNALPTGEVLRDVTVTVDVAAAQDNSLRLTLIAPNGARIPLVRPSSGINGSGGFRGTTFSSSDPNAIPLSQGSPNNNFASPPTYIPAASLAALDGTTIRANQTWGLEVRVLASSPQTATINDFSVTYQPASTALTNGTGNKLDQNVKAYLNTLPGSVNLGDNTDFFASPTPINSLPNSVLDQYGANVAANPLPSATPFSGPFDPNTLPLIVPGPHVIDSAVADQPAAPGNLVINGAVSSLNVTFDRDIDRQTFTSGSVLRVMGPVGQIPGPFKVTPLGARTFQIMFPTSQVVSGTYTVTLASNIADVNGNQLDTNQNAGLSLLRGVTGGASTTVFYTAPATFQPSPFSRPVPNVPLPLADGKTSVSTLTVPDNFLANAVSVQLDITDANDQDLQITLVAPNGASVLLVPRGTGKAGTHANFTGTVFADPGNPNYSPTTPITNGSPPFASAYFPAQALSALNGTQAKGDWKLVIDDQSVRGTDPAGTLNSWSLKFQRGVSPTGLGEQVADQANVSFRIFTTDRTNAQSSNTWTGVGPAPLVNTGTTPGSTPGFAGQVSAVAVDMTDPSGNTVFASGASGGVWKTTNFLTTDAQGPNWTPLTDFGPNSGVNIGSIAVFPRNNDQRQTIVIAGTGDSSSSDQGHPGGPTSNGVGFIISMDGGASWRVLDSTNNALPFASRDHIFAQPGASGLGTSTVRMVVDPRLTPNGQVIIYAALKGAQGGLWQSNDTGQTWTRLSAASMGAATDVTLDYTSATIDALTNPTGNINTIYAAFPGSGVYLSPNRGQTLNLLTGGNTNPLFHDVENGSVGVAVNNGANAPTGQAGGRIFLAKPAPVPSSNPNADVENILYERWLYAAVVNGGVLDGVYLTKDNGQTWTKLQITGLNANGFLPHQAIPTNDSSQPQYNVTNSPIFTHGDYDSAFVIDPTNPNVTYLGGTTNGNYSGFIRIDATTVEDSHALVPTSNSKNDGGLSRYNSTGAVSINNKNFSLPFFYGTTNSFAQNQSPYLNLTLDPNNPFAVNSTILTYNVAAFTNDGYGVKWTPIDGLLSNSANSSVPSTNIHSIVTFVDPLTGNTRLLVGDDQGVFSGELTPNGTLTTGIGTAAIPAYSRNGNLQLAQVNYGAAQPSLGLGNGATPPGLFYGNSYNLGQFMSDPNVLADGNTASQGSTDGGPAGIFSASSADQFGVGIAVDQQGNNVAYRYLDPAYGGNGSDFLQVSTDGGQNWVSRTTGLVQVPNDPQWPGQSPTYGGGSNLVTGASTPGSQAINFGNFAINPIDSNQAIISSNVGRIFSTTNQGKFWTSIGEPGVLDGSYAPALAFGAPSTTGTGNLNNLLYAGTVKGNIFVNNGTNWTFVSTGLDGSPVVKIIADPNRGTKDAYAVTQQGVYYNPNTTAAGAFWTNITANLFKITSNPFGVSNFSTAGAPINAAQPLLSYLTTIQADWRYVIPNAPTTGIVAAGPTTHPVLYVGGNGGVFRSLDNGATWSQFPSIAVDKAPFDGGYLPVVHVTDLSTSLGKINQTSGLPEAAPGDPNVLLASTYGRGQFSIRLAPLVLPGTVALDTRLPGPGGSVSGKDARGNPLVKTSQPVINGVSELSGLGNTVRISILDLTDPSNPVVIGGYDPAKGPIGNNPTDTAGSRTDTSGRFQVQVNADGFKSNGLKTIGIQATDQSGTKGNIATLTFTLQARLTANTAPAAPTLGLSAGQDTSVGFNATSNNRPFVGGTTDPGVPVQVFIVSRNGAPDGTLLPQTVSDANGNYTVQFPNILPDAVYVLQAVAYNPTNNSLHSKSPNYTFTVETVAPTGAPTFYIEDANKAPVPSRNITTTNRLPVFVGNTVPFGNVRLYQSNSLVPLNSTRADSTGRYEIRLPSALNNGTITLRVQASDAANNLDRTFSSPLTLTVFTPPADYTGAGKTTPALFRRNANGTVSFVIGGSSQIFAGGSSSQDIPLSGDFDGDGITDKALYRPGAGAFFIARSRSGGETLSLAAQNTPGSLPVVGDFEGSGLSEVGLYDPANGVWTLNEATRGVVQVKINSKLFSPKAGDVPVPGDYDGTGVSELSVFRPSTGQFFIQVPGTSGGYDNVRVTASLDPTQNASDVPVPGNYDDTLTRHITEAAVFNPSTGNWYIQGHAAPDKFNPGDIPAPGDYDGLGRTEEAVYRPSIAAFAVNGPSGIVKIGAAGDIPVTAPLAYRNLPAGPPTLALFNATTPGGDFTTARHPIFGGQTTPGAVVNLIDASGKVVNSAQADGNGNYAVGDPASLFNGTYSYTVRAVNLVGGIGAPTQPLFVHIGTVKGDYTGAGVTQPALFLRGPSKALTLYVLNDKALNGLPFSTGQGDVPIVADFLGTGTDQIAIFTPSRGDWTIAQARTGYAPQLYLHGFGASAGGGYIPVPGDYNGNGIDRAAVYETTTGRWFVQGQGSALGPITRFQAGDVPVPGNYDNTGKDELALFRPGTDTWYINGPSGTHQIAFGGAGDIPVPGNYFSTTASPTTTEAVWRPSVGEFLIRTPGGGTQVVAFQRGDIPAPGDYDGIGRTEPAVYRPSTGQFLVTGPRDVSPRVVNPSQSFGNASFVPLAAPYVYRAVPVPVVRAATPAPRVVRRAAAVNLAATARTFQTQTAPRSLTPPSAVAPRTGGMLKALVATRKGV